MRSEAPIAAFFGWSFPDSAEARGAARRLESLARLQLLPVGCTAVVSLAFFATMSGSGLIGVIASLVLSSSLLCMLRIHVPGILAADLRLTEEVVKTWTPPLGVLSVHAFYQFVMAPMTWRWIPLAWLELPPGSEGLVVIETAATTWFAWAMVVVWMGVNLYPTWRLTRMPDAARVVARWIHERDRQDVLLRHDGCQAKIRRIFEGFGIDRPMDQPPPLGGTQRRVGYGRGVVDATVTADELRVMIG